MARILDDKYLETPGIGQSIKDNSTNIKGATYFIPSVTAPINTVALSLKKTGTPTGTVTVSIYSNNSGEPGTLLVTSDTRDPSSFATDLQEEEFVFSNLYILVANTGYWIVYEASQSVDVNNYTTIGISSPEYRAEAKRFNNFSVWDVPFGGGFSYYFKEYYTLDGGFAAIIL